MLVKKAYKKMVILHKLCPFKVPVVDLVLIYKFYVRSILEQNCPVWHLSLTQEDQQNLERVQKVACKIILGEHYLDYTQALKNLNLENLVERRDKLCLKFAQKCLKHPRAKSLFPRAKKITYDTRSHDTYFVQPAKTDRLKNSAIPQMQRALNRKAKKTS